jgi:hypothetical protein
LTPSRDGERIRAPSDVLCTLAFESSFGRVSEPLGVLPGVFGRRGHADACLSPSRSRSGGTTPPLIVLAGLAGVGKTALLARLSGAGEHVVDLEALAGHRGSAFGGLGQPPQPEQAHFDRAVSDALAAGGRPVYVEDEGAFVGSLSVPSALCGLTERAPVVEIVAALPIRIARLVADYGSLDPALLIRATQRLRRRLGGPVADRAISHIAAGRPGAAISALLPHFDAAYRHRSERLARPVLARFEVGEGSLNREGGRAWRSNSARRHGTAAG